MNITFSGTSELNTGHVIVTVCLGCIENRSVKYLRREKNEITHLAWIWD